MITSNLPMILPLVSRCCRPIIGSLRSFSTAHKPSKSTRNRAANGCPFLEDKNPRRGLGPRSINPIPDLTFNGSDENIFARPELETDAESGHVPAKRRGGIMKQTSLEIIEMRQTEEEAEEQDVGDYYLVKQLRESELLSRNSSVGKLKRASATFGIGTAV